MYFIICFERLPDHEFDDIGCVRTFGFFESYEEAKEKLNCNYTDMNETIYDYAVVEELIPGIYPRPKSKHYFKFDKEKDGFFEIETPLSLKKEDIISFIM